MDNVFCQMWFGRKLKKGSKLSKKPVDNHIELLFSEDEEEED